MLAFAAIGESGCSTFPGAAKAGRRALLDGFVSVTAPVQVPWLAARDANVAAARDASAGASSSWRWPLRFVGDLFAEAGLCALHTVDLAAAPIHLVAGNGPPKIYRGCDFPLEHVEQSSEEFHQAVGELALYDVAGVGGVAVSYWLAVRFVPALLHPFWLPSSS